MPNAIDRCGSCGQSVYFEANVVGACGCPEREFRILLAQQRQRNNSGNPDFASAYMSAESPDLGQIDPGILMSAAGRSEFDFARQASGQRTPFQAQAPQAPPLRGRPELAVYFDDASFGPTARTMLENNSYGPPSEDVYAQEPMEEVSFDGGEDEDWTGLSSQAPQRHQARVASVARRMDDVDLAAMWMQGTGIPFDRGQLVAPGGDGFEFDNGEMAVDASYPRGGGGSSGRFRVDQAVPARPAFNRARVDDGGVEIGRVGRGGRFEGRPQLQPRPQPAPPPNVFETIRATMNEPAARPEPAPRAHRPAPVSAIQQARDIQAKSRGPSVYDLLRRDPLRK